MKVSEIKRLLKLPERANIVIYVDSDCTIQYPRNKKFK